ncbi:hypothetical protein [Nesterenkonia sp. NBAIMH1]|uniref:hypothetical protein n=1 Tax=Nesterenkonia sp. NBAIMH1 TaxID=2600320 RepID=UPI0011B6C1D4|nr:hypothetical protein [Nesterenkonia sp. NBAIMH1]
MNASVRLNKEHLHISVLCALWHLYLANGKPLEFLRTIDALHGMVAKKEFHSFFNLGFNVSLSLRALTLLQVRRGDVKAAQITSDLALEMFQLSVRDSTSNFNHFKEVGYTHSHALEAMRLSRRTKSADDALVRRTLSRTLRIPEDTYPQAFETMHETFLAAAELVTPDTQPAQTPTTD